MERDYALHRLSQIASQLDAAQRSLDIVAIQLVGPGSAFEMRDDDGMKVNLSSIANDLRVIANALD